MKIMIIDGEADFQMPRILILRPDTFDDEVYLVAVGHSVTGC